MPITFKQRNIWLLIIGILLVISGIYVLFNPVAALVASALTIGLILIVVGTGYLITFRQTNSYITLIMGILDILIGVLFLTNLGITAVTMPIIFGLWVLFNGIAQIVMAIELKNKITPAKKWLFAAGIFGIIFSMLIFAYPVVGTLTLTLLLGIYLIGYGGFEINRYINNY